MDGIRGPVLLKELYTDPCRGQGAGRSGRGRGQGKAGDTLKELYTEPCRGQGWPRGRGRRHSLGWAYSWSGKVLPEAAMCPAPPLGDRPPKVGGSPGPSPPFSRLPSGHPAVAWHRLGTDRVAPSGCIQSFDAPAGGGGAVSRAVATPCKPFQA